MSHTARQAQPTTRRARLAALAGATVLAGASFVAAAPAAGAAGEAGAYKPDQGRQPIFFASDREAGLPQIYRMTPGQKGAVRLTDSATSDSQPSANRDRTVVAFTSQKMALHQFRQIELMNADGSGRRTIISGNAHFMDPSLSPDGTKLVFTQLTGTNSQILMINTGGTGLRQLTTTPDSKNREPAWSPDGQKIAFTSQRYGYSDIWIMGTSGDQSPERVTYDQMGAAEPAWSPDGQKIAYSFYNSSTQDTEVQWVDAYSVNVIHNVSNHPGGDDREPCWTPDGKNIVFTSDNGGQQDLIAGNLGGTDTYRVTGKGDRNFDADCGYPGGRHADNPFAGRPPVASQS